MAERAADFAGEFVLDGFLGWIVPFEIMVAICEVDVFFVEDGSPLEGCGWRVSTLAIIFMQQEDRETCRVESGRLCNGRVCCLEVLSG